LPCAVPPVGTKDVPTPAVFVDARAGWTPQSTHDTCAFPPRPSQSEHFPCLRSGVPVAWG